MEKYGLFCFDLYDSSECTAVNLPHGYKICNAPLVGMTNDMGAEVRSWEVGWGMRAEDIRPGQERFAVPEGSHLALLRHGEPFFFFEIPRRGVLAAFVYTQPRI